MCSDNKNSGAVGFAIGAVLGAGAGVFLSTKKGKKIVKQAWKQIEPFIDDAVDDAKDEFEDIKVKASEFKTRAEDRVDQTVSEIKDFANEKIPASIKKPIKKAFFKGI